MLNQKAIEIALSKVEDAIATFTDISDRAAKAAVSLKAARRILAAASGTSHASVAPDYSDYIADAAWECGMMVRSISIRGSKWTIAVQNSALAKTFADVLSQLLGRNGHDVDVWNDGYLIFIDTAIHD